MLHFIYSNIFPPTCSLCDLASSTTVDLCLSCLESLPHNSVACLTCGLPLIGNTGHWKQPYQHKKILCGKCLSHSPAIKEAIIPFLYQPPVDYMVKRLKFSADMKYSRLMGELLANAASKQHTIRPDVLIPVPLHQERLLERGYNQAFQIADIIGRRLNIPVDQQSIRRVGQQNSQVKLNARDRAKNMRRAFSVAREINGRKIAIIDDVYTTGATVQSLADLLVKAGASSVSVWAFSRTP